MGEEYILLLVILRLFGNIRYIRTPYDLLPLEDVLNISVIPMSFKLGERVNLGLVDLENGLYILTINLNRLLVARIHSRELSCKVMGLDKLEDFAILLLARLFLKRRNSSKYCHFRLVNEKP